MSHRLGRAAGLAAAVLAGLATLLTAGGPAWGQAIIPITLDETPVGKPTAVDLARQKLDARGLLENVQWSISLQFQETPLSKALEYLCETAQAKPRELNVVVDRKGITEAGVDLNDPVTLVAKDLSLKQALERVLPSGLGYVIQNDGTVLVSSRYRLNENLPTRYYLIGSMLRAVRHITSDSRIEASRIEGGGVGGLFTDGEAFEPEMYGSELLRTLIERMVRGDEPWESVGGRSTLEFHNKAMIVSATEEMHQQVVALCRNVLAFDKLREDALSLRLTGAENTLAAMRDALAERKKALRGLYVKAGRDDWQLTRTALMAEAARGLAGPLTLEELLAVVDDIERVKSELEDLQTRLDGQRRLVQVLWEEVNDIPPPGAVAATADPAAQVDAAEPVAPAAPLSGDAATAASGGNAFACDLYGRLSKEDGNVFFSPYSISSALAMTWAGARGQTAEQMAKVLHFDLPQEKLHPAMHELIGRISGPGGAKRSYQLSVANALWGQVGYEFRKEFLDLNAANYGATLQSLDFEKAVEAARQTINAAVAAKTQDKIKDLIAPGVLNPDGNPTRLVLTNAIYFKGRWRVPFERSATKNEPFTLRDGKQVAVPMMQQTEHLGYLKGEGFQAVSLDYVGGDLAMIVLLPDTVDGLAALEKSLTAANLAAWTAKMSPKAVHLALPRFKMTQEVQLKKTLLAMGMTDAFSAKADFSAMTNQENAFCISAVIHKAFVEVNEEGTEAAAATGIVVSEGEVEEIIPFRADHPFLVLIRHKATGCILFLGRVMNPAS